MGYWLLYKGEGKYYLACDYSAWENKWWYQSTNYYTKVIDKYAVATKLGYWKLPQYLGINEWNKFYQASLILMHYNHTFLVFYKNL